MIDETANSDDDGRGAQSLGGLSGVRGKAGGLIFRRRVAGALIVVSLIMFALSVVLLVYSIGVPYGPSCGSATPSVHITPSPIWNGYEFRIMYATYEVDAECYDVAVKTNGTYWSSFPRTLSEANMGIGPAEETLSFVDSNGDGRLTSGDTLVLESLQSGADYELVLIWASSGANIASETVRSP